MGSSTRSIPRSFADSNGDGIGDLPGIIEHLDYLGPDGLGVDALWLSPIFPSPGHDLGYDVSDHERVDPLFGTEADFDRLVEAAHRRGIRIVLDLVMNHTSSRCIPWFVESRARRDGPSRGLVPVAATHRATGPTASPSRRTTGSRTSVALAGSGTSTAGSSTTTRSSSSNRSWTGEAPGVEDAQFGMVRGWLARGVDGFRLDVFNRFLKHPELPSNPTQPGSSAWARQIHVNDGDQPDFPELIGRFRDIVDERPGRMSIGELFDGTVERAAGLTADRHLVFDWELVESAWTGAGIRAAIARREAAFGDTAWPTVVLSNHDRPRLSSRLADPIAGADRDAVARAAAVLLLTVRGTPCLYYGEELGLPDVNIPAAESVDPPAAHVGPDFDWWDRSRCRAPMPWAAGPGAGFTTGQPWLRFGLDADTRNVAAQAADPSSVLSLYRRLIALRAGEPRAPGRHAPARSGRDRRSRRLHAGSRRAGRRRGLQPRPEPGLVAAPGRVTGRGVAADPRDVARSDAGRGDRRRCLRSTSRPTRRASSSGSADRPAHRPCYHDGRSTVTIPGSTTCRLIS